MDQGQRRADGLPPGARRPGQAGPAEAVAGLDGHPRPAPGTATRSASGTLGPAGVRKMITDQIPINDGRLSPTRCARSCRTRPSSGSAASVEVLAAASTSRTCSTTGEIDGSSPATGGRYTGVEWQPDADGGQPGAGHRRPARGRERRGGHRSGTGLAQVTPNVGRGAELACGPPIGGGIHRAADRHHRGQHPGRRDVAGSEGWNRTAGADIRDPGPGRGRLHQDSNNVVVVADSRWSRHRHRHPRGGARAGPRAGLDARRDPDRGRLVHRASTRSSRTFHEKHQGPRPVRRRPRASRSCTGTSATRTRARSRTTACHGHKEVFAEGYAAYAAGLQTTGRAAGAPAPGPITEETALRADRTRS